MSNEIKITLTAISDIGLVRANNEDAYVIVDPAEAKVYDSPSSTIVQPLKQQRLLLVVSDGMGGAEGGEIASKLTVETIRDYFPKLSKRLSPQSRLEASVEEANSVVWEYAKTDPNLEGMGATVTVAYIESGVAYVAEVGDSRCYIIRGNRIKQITKDQTMAQVMIDAGALRPETAARSPMKNMLLQAIGDDEYLQVAVSSLRLCSGDILLLCTDGLHGKVKDEEIKNVVNNSANLETAARTLVQFAKQRGGDDNITLVIAKFEGSSLFKPDMISTITDTMTTISRFNPHQEGQPRPKRETRAATFDDLLASALVEHFVQDKQQYDKLAQLSDYGEYILLRRGDTLFVQNEEPSDSYYLLISGRYRVEHQRPDGRRETIAFMVSPTDRRSDEEIRSMLEYVRVKRQFFTGGSEMLTGKPRTATVICEDSTNVAVRIPRKVHDKLKETLGEKLELSLRYS
ncbi:MAG: Stp1/IreP family PP2C-type Ser/Thr phosphatase [Acidobacteriota bacterium]|nr:Stp1/IreP family PP2C-type Ser/Thr phosphatase [Blastocatellia bacterium]MDW8413188.1 Stp1/IreP family PP2C-type Ser/Thr phosphatase [Acidobacteriota bacterium]